MPPEYQKREITNLAKALKETGLWYKYPEHTFTEGWGFLGQSDAREVFYNLYRDMRFNGSIFLDQMGSDEKDWVLPPYEIHNGVDSGDGRIGFNTNCVVVRNSRDGATVTPCYIGYRHLAAKRMGGMFDAYLPDPAGLPADSYVYIGFEAPGMGGYNSAFLAVTNGVDNVYLNIGGFDENQRPHRELLGIALSFYDSWQRYFLDYDPPYMRLWEPSVSGGNPDTLVGEIKLSQDAALLNVNTNRYLTFFVENASTSIVDTFKLGRLGIFGYDRDRSTNEIILWDSQTITNADGLDSGVVETLGVDKKCFYLLSDQAATVGTGNEGMFLQVWDPVNSAYVTVTGISVVANELASIETYRASRRMRINFLPAVDAAVDLWAVLE